MAEKTVLRKKYIQIRKNIPNKDKKSDMIMQRLLDSGYIENAETIALYNSLSQEVQTKKLIEKLLGQGKKIYLPTVCGEEMDFYRIKSLGDALNKGVFGVYEPEINESMRLDKTALDAVIMPGVCFDKNRNRIGFGKGYYDGFLKNINDVIKIALCFDEQILKNDLIEAQEKDISPDIMISEKNIYCDTKADKLHF